MKAISLWEPWASLMATGAKTIETRSWQTHYRGPLLICAAKNMGPFVIHMLCHWTVQSGLAPLVGKPIDYTWKSWPGIKARHLGFGKAVAVVDLIDCRPTDNLTLGEIEKEKPFGDFSVGRYAWTTEFIERIENPFPVKGRQGLFNVEYEMKGDPA